MGVDYTANIGIRLTARQGALFGMRPITLEERGELSATIRNPLHDTKYLSHAPMDDDATHVLKIGEATFSVRRLYKSGDEDATAFWLPFFAKEVSGEGRCHGLELDPEELILFAARTLPLVQAGAIFRDDVWAC